MLPRHCFGHAATFETHDNAGIVDTGHGDRLPRHEISPRQYGRSPTRRHYHTRLVMLAGRRLQWAVRAKAALVGAGTGSRLQAVGGSFVRQPGWPRRSSISGYVIAAYGCR